MRTKKEIEEEINHLQERLPCMLTPSGTEICQGKIDHLKWVLEETDDSVIIQEILQKFEKLPIHEKKVLRRMIEGRL